ncbi:WD domain, G-beta repeat [Carpediemonas membranifera]|uniref:WD domain, G-beta repeat n=1 Tax=Carpediemonas membranifera TaxID=201153 RepID=A0A8J6B2T3_9EUKA|nr:WD domain, G-beta repeat [Carpediemonas membranifera]|eukprot:KAG9394503.1 WD domain, G-beta repeat [Carpediemonas membranifera]
MGIEVEVSQAAADDAFLAASGSNYELFVDVDQDVSAQSSMVLRETIKDLDGSKETFMILVPRSDTETTSEMMMCHVTIPTESYMRANPNALYQHHRHKNLRHPMIEVRQTQLCELPDECNRIRQTPVSARTYRIATRHADGSVLLFKGINSDPVTLNGAAGDFFPLAWSATGDLLATASDDASVAVWDINNGNGRPKIVHTPWKDETINDICFSSNQGNLVIVSYNNGHFAVLDPRTATAAFAQTRPDRQDVMCAKQTGEGYVITCHSNKWDLLDLRSPTKPLYTGTTSRQGEIWNLECSPFSNTVFATGATNGVVSLWDLSRIGREKPTSCGNAKPELLFEHRGHSASVNDLQWTHRDWTVLSTGGDCMMQLWEPTRSSHRTVTQWDAELISEEARLIGY